MRNVAIVILVALVLTKTAAAQSVEAAATTGDQRIAEYFRAETQKLSDRTFADIETLEDWTGKRSEYRRQMLEMLGCHPRPRWNPS